MADTARKKTRSPTLARLHRGRHRRSPATFDTIAISSLTHPTVLTPPTTPQTLLSLRATPSDDGAAKTHLDDDAILPGTSRGMCSRGRARPQQKKKANVAYQSNGETSKDDTDHDQLEQADPCTSWRSQSWFTWYERIFNRIHTSRSTWRRGAAAATEAEAKQQPKQKPKQQQKPKQKPKQQQKPKQKPKQQQ